ncbi:MAG: ORF6N domain-containing protein [Bacteroidaceae bacterium]|nr:ORF6N domain-containing protein [Bacteroidaceae bacterium]
MNDIELIRNKIYEIRGQRVMLDFDLASLYQVETRVLNQAVKRNLERFPEDFMFQLTTTEWNLISSQFVMTSRRKRPKSALPLAFTEHGALMLASVLRSDVAVEISIKVTRAFVAVRRSLSLVTLPQKMIELEYGLKELRKEVDDILSDQNDINEDTRAQLDAISTALVELQSEYRSNANKPHRPIGFTATQD